MLLNVFLAQGLLLCAGIRHGRVSENEENCPSPKGANLARKKGYAT